MIVNEYYLLGWFYGCLYDINRYLLSTQGHMAALDRKLFRLEENKLPQTLTREKDVYF